MLSKCFKIKIRGITEMNQEQIAILIMGLIVLIFIIISVVDQIRWGKSK